MTTSRVTDSERAVQRASCLAPHSLPSLLFGIALSVAVFGIAYGAAPSAVAEQEIQHLLVYLGKSGCEFNRNGDWHPAGKARAHLERKHSALLRRKWTGSAEDFISAAASKSSVSGKPYLVRCLKSGTTPSKVWFRAELVRYRAAATAER